MQQALWVSSETVVDLGKVFKDRNMLGALFYAHTAGNALRSIDFTQRLVVLDRVIPGTHALEMIENGKDLRNGDSLRSDMTIVAASTGDQCRSPHLCAGFQHGGIFLFRKHSRVGICRIAEVFLHLVCLAHTA